MRVMLHILSTRKFLFLISFFIAALVKRYPSNSNYEYAAIILGLSLLNICIVTAVHSAHFQYKIIDMIKCLNKIRTNNYE